MEYWHPRCWASSVFLLYRVFAHKGWSPRTGRPIPPRRRCRSYQTAWDAPIWFQWFQCFRCQMRRGPHSFGRKVPRSPPPRPPLRNLHPQNQPWVIYGPSCRPNVAASPRARPVVAARTRQEPRRRDLFSGPGLWAASRRPVMNVRASSARRRRLCLLVKPGWNAR